MTTFKGFQPPTSNTTYTPNQFFDVVLPYSSRGVVRLLACIIRKTLGWSDAQGNPQQEKIAVSYREFVSSAHIAQSMLRAALDEATEANFIKAVYPGRPHVAGNPGAHGLYELKWDEEGREYIKGPKEFRGFYAGQGNRTYIPNSFFDYMIPNEPLAVVKVVGAIIRQTIGWHNKFGNRRQQVAMSFSELHRRTKIVSRRALNDALQTSLNHNYLIRLEEGVFDPNAGKLSKPATYSIKWTDSFGQAQVIEGLFEKVVGERFEKDTGNASKSVPGKRLEKDTGIEITIRNNTKKQQQRKTTSKSSVVVVSKIPDELLESYKQLIEQGFKESAARDIITKPLAMLEEPAASPKELAQRIKRQCEWIDQRTIKGSRLGMLRRAIERDYSEPKAAGARVTLPRSSPPPLIDSECIAKEKARKSHEDRFKVAHFDYLRVFVGDEAFRSFLEQSANERKMKEKNPAYKAEFREMVLAHFDSEESRYNRLMKFCRENKYRILDFWAWDKELNPDRLTP